MARTRTCKADGVSHLKRLLQYLHGKALGLRCRPSASPVLTSVGGVGKEPLGAAVLVEGTWPEAAFGGEWPRSRVGASMGWAGIIETH